MVLSNKQSNALLKELYQGKSTEYQQKLAIRNLTMTNLMLRAGLRTVEVVELLITDLLVADKPLETLNLIRGIPQGRNARTVLLNENIRLGIGQMNEYWWKLDREKPGNFAFYDKSPLRHISVSQFRRIINKAGLNALGYPVKPNLLRRTCAVNLFQKTDRQTVRRCLDYKTDQDWFFY